MNNILRTIGLSLILFCFFMPKIQAQTASHRIAQLRQELEEAQKKRLPKTVQSKALEIIKLASNNKLFIPLLQASVQLTEARIQQDNQSFSLKPFRDIQELTWLSDRDRAVLALITAENYYKYQQIYNWRQPLSEANQTYLKTIKELLDKAFANVQLLNSPIGQYASLFPNYKEHLKSDLLLARMLKSLTDIRLPQGIDTQSFALELLSKANSTDTGLTPQERIYLEAKQLILTEDKHAKKLSLYEAFVERYAQHPEILPFVRTELLNLYSKKQQKLEAIDRFLKLYPEQPQAEIKALKTIHQELMTLYWHIQAPTYIVGHRRHPIILSSNYITELTLNYYRRPQVLSPNREWTPKPNAKPTLTKSFSISPRADKGIHQDTLYTDLPTTGEYLLIADIKKLPEAYLRQSDEDNLQDRHHLQVTDHMVLEFSNSKYQLQWLDPITGAPRAKKNLRLYGNENNIFIKRTQTDQEGYTQYLPTDKSLILVADDPADPLKFTDFFWEHQEVAFDPNATELSIWSITDRAIYRPGQKVKVAGRLSRIGYHSEQASVVAQYPLKLILRDASNNELTSHNVQTSVWGVFSAEFTLPQQGLNGWHSITITSSENKTLSESHHFRVEEYKRPSYEVTLTPPPHELHLGDSLLLQGQALEYSGAPVSGANITATIEITKHYPWRWSSRGQYINDARATIQVNAITKADGLFTLPLKLIDPQPKTLDAQDANRLKPFYSYRINVQATHSTGEMQETDLLLTLGEGLDQLTLTGLDAPINRDRLEGAVQFSAKDFLDRSIQTKVSYTLYNAQGTALKADSIATEQALPLKQLLQGLPSGAYTLHYRTASIPKEKELSQRFVLFSTREKQIDIDGQPLFVGQTHSTYSATKTPSVWLASALPQAYVYYRINYEGGEVKRGMLMLKQNTLQEFILPTPKGYTAEVLEASFHTVYQGRIYNAEAKFTREEPNKTLELRWQTFRDRIKPGSEQTWSMQVFHQGKPIQANLLSWMFDASLEAIAPYRLPKVQLKLETDIDTPSPDPRIYDYSLNTDIKPQYRDDEGELISSSSSYDMSILAYQPSGFNVVGETALRSAKAIPQALMSKNKAENAPSVRKNFAETAYFLPEQTTDSLGIATWTFRLPESLTQWSLFVVAHTKGMDIGQIRDTVQTYQELMVRPNLPRFIRWGDEVQLRVNVQNMSEDVQSGELKLELFDPTNGTILHQAHQAFNTPATSHETLSFILPKQNKGKELGVRLLATTPSFSDGEQHLLPLLPDTEELIRTKAITLTDTSKHKLSLAELFPSSGERPSQGSLSLSLESNPLLLALEAIPNLGSPKASDALSLASSLYAHSLIHQLATNEQLMAWIKERQKQAHTGLHADRKQMRERASEATPWSKRIASDNDSIRIEALSEFIQSSANPQTEQAILNKLSKLQNSSGLWSWYPSMPGNLYMTEYIVRLLIRSTPNLSVQGKKQAQILLSKGWKAMDAEANKELKRLQKVEAKRQKPSISRFAHVYLYLSELGKRNSPQQAQLLMRLPRKVHELPLLLKAFAGVSLSKHNHHLSLELLRSLKEHLTQDAQGAYFANEPSQGYWWMNRSYALQTAMIEAMLLLAPEDSQTLSALQQWLLGQKRAVRWESTTATAEAIHALMLGQPRRQAPSIGHSWAVINDAQGTPLAQAQGERLSLAIPLSKEQSPEHLELKAQGSPQVWVALTARYPLPSKETTAFGSELQVMRKLFLEEVSDGQPKLVPITADTKLQAGDKLVTQLIIKIDRDMDFVTLSDPRIGFAEPVLQTSGYTHGTPTSYYYEPKDSTTNFYLDHLSRGEYLIEYRQHIVRPGVYSLPATKLQSTYAPEYSASSGFGGQFISH